MDASGEDKDITLQKTAGQLIDELDNLLPNVLGKKGNVETPVKTVPVDSLNSLLDLLLPFQESPQLLDPHLTRLTSYLTTAFLASLSITQPSPFLPTGSSNTLHVCEAICRLIYTFAKIRGWKVITRFLPNEPKWLETLTTLLESKNVVRQVKSQEKPPAWEISYVLLLWLAHLSLAPFDLSTIGSEGELLEADGKREFPDENLEERIPALGARLLRLGVEHVGVASARESDAAALLLVRIGLRRDMRALGVLDSLTEWCFAVLESGDESISVFKKTGILKVLGGILSQGDRPSVKPYINRIFAITTSLQDAGMEAEESEGSSAQGIWNSAVIRKLVMKLFRWTGILSLPPLGSTDFDDADVQMEIVEELINRLLISLGDRDTTVRIGASKSLALLTSRLPAAMSAEVVDAVISGFDEDVFTDSAGNRSYAAVSAERWHGLTLTLATFIRQRVLATFSAEDPTLLARALNCVLSALSFEQRKISSFGAGGNVRDAANYAAWSLARNYATDELLSVDISLLEYTWLGIAGREVSLLQILAIALVVTACLDPLGNIRRGSSAALQELVGRHPNTIIEGIPLVQTVDYQSVALRRRSMVDIALETALLGEIYWIALTNCIVNGWRGTGATDTDGRKIAATSLGRLVDVQYDGSDVLDVWNRALSVVDALLERASRESVKDVEVRHGVYLALASVIPRLTSLKLQNESLGFPSPTQHSLLTIFNYVTARILTHSPLRPDLSCEGCCALISALCGSVPTLLSYTSSAARIWLAIVDVCLSRTDAVVMSEAASATASLFRIISPTNRGDVVEEWCRRIDITSGRGARGYIHALGAIIDVLKSDGDNGDWRDERARITDVLVTAAGTREVEARVAAMNSLAVGLFAKAGEELRSSEAPELVRALERGLDDYASDSRGDVGSWVRTEAIKAVEFALEKSFFEGDAESLLGIAQRVVRLAAERLDKLRLQAFTVLQKMAPSIPELDAAIAKERQDLFVITQPLYFSHLLRLTTIPSLTTPLLTGYILTAGGAGDSLLRTSLTVLFEFFFSSPANLQSTLFTSLVSILKSTLDSGDFLADRNVPALTVLSSMADLNLWDNLPVDVVRPVYIATWKSHHGSTNVQKLFAATGVYTALAMYPVPSGSGADAGTVEKVKKLRTDARKRLLALLGHKFPRVRERASEGLWIVGLAEGWAEGAESLVRVGEWGGRGWKEGLKGVETWLLAGA